MASELSVYLAALYTPQGKKGQDLEPSLYCLLHVKRTEEILGVANKSPRYSFVRLVVVQDRSEAF